eukprot:scaffold22021_cov51-Attheya_sp.AAC.3
MKPSSKAFGHKHLVSPICLLMMLESVPWLQLVLPSSYFAAETLKLQRSQYPFWQQPVGA